MDQPVASPAAVRGQSRTKRFTHEARERAQTGGFVLSLICMLLAWLMVDVQVGYAAQRYELHNSVSPRASAAHWLRGADADEALEMSVTLRLRQTTELAALIAAQQDPTSLDYHRWLTPQEFANRFAPSTNDYNAVVDWLLREGFVVRPQLSGARIDFSGTVATVERTFGVHMNHYEYRDRTPVANDAPALLPSEFVDTVDVVRLNTFPLAEPLVRVSGSAGVTTAMAPVDMYIAYDMQALLDKGVDGSGQTVAVVARSDFNLSDVASFQQQFGVPLHNAVKVFSSTNPGVGAPNGVCRGIRSQRQLRLCTEGEEGEVLLDTEWASAMAPGATLLVDISGSDIDVSLLDIVTNHPEAKTITISFGACERLDGSDISLFGHMYAQAAAQGQTVLVAAGDDGADGCQDGRGRSVNALASDPNVTAVGGTALDPGFDARGDATAYRSESVWNDADGASGGGPSTLVAKPSYQNGPGVPNDGARDQPDVSLLASPSQAGYAMVFQGTVDVAGGTSGSTPSWAGIVALLNGALQVDGSGPLNATLYTLGRRQYGENGVAVFHDITEGNNGFNRVPGYTAAPGYDLASGLGSPDVALLAAVLRALGNTPTATPTPTAPSTQTLIGTPTPAPTLSATVCAGDCNNDHTVTVTELVRLENIAFGSATISSCTAGDLNHDGQITIEELLAAVNAVLDGCAIPSGSEM